PAKFSVAHEAVWRRGGSPFHHSSRSRFAARLNSRVRLHMKIYVSRSSVAAGDDVNAPNSESLSVPDGTDLREIVQGIAASGYLPRIAGGQATWSVTSNVLVAVVAQQWTEPRMFVLDLMNFDELD